MSIAGPPETHDSRMCNLEVTGQPHPNQTPSIGHCRPASATARRLFFHSFFSGYYVPCTQNNRRRTTLYPFGWYTGIDLEVARPRSFPYSNYVHSVRWPFSRENIYTYISPCRSRSSGRFGHTSETTDLTTRESKNHKKIHTAAGARQQTR